MWSWAWLRWMASLEKLHVLGSLERTLLQRDVISSNNRHKCEWVNVQIWIARLCISFVFLTVSHCAVLSSFMHVIFVTSFSTESEYLQLPSDYRDFNLLFALPYIFLHFFHCLSLSLSFQQIISNFSTSIYKRVRLKSTTSSKSRAEKKKVHSESPTW